MSFVARRRVRRSGNGAARDAEALPAGLIRLTASSRRVESTHAASQREGVNIGSSVPVERILPDQAAAQARDLGEKVLVRRRSTFGYAVTVGTDLSISKADCCPFRDRCATILRDIRPTNGRTQIHRLAFTIRSRNCQSAYFLSRCADVERRRTRR
jgi:hypothetical protein